MYLQLMFPQSAIALTFSDTLLGSNSRTFDRRSVARCCRPKQIRGCSARTAKRLCTGPHRWDSNRPLVSLGKTQLELGGAPSWPSNNRDNDDKDEQPTDGIGYPMFYKPNVWGYH